MDQKDFNRNLDGYLGKVRKKEGTPIVFSDVLRFGKKERKFKSIKFLAMESEELDFCGCKMSDRPPFCDGTHSWTKF